MPDYEGLVRAVTNGIDDAMAAAVTRVSDGEVLAQRSVIGGLDGAAVAKGGARTLAAELELLGRLGMATQFESLVVTLSDHYHLFVLLDADVALALAWGRGGTTQAAARLAVARAAREFLPGWQEPGWKDASGDENDDQSAGAEAAEPEQPDERRDEEVEPEPLDERDETFDVVAWMGENAGPDGEGDETEKES